MTDLVTVHRALLSVSDKTGLADFAAALVNEFNIALISTGGTAKFLRDAGLPVTDVSDVTGFPEMMDGRIKTLHPLIHGGLLAQRDNADHLAAMKGHAIAPIDLVCINLYPFAKTIENPDVTMDEAIENIDIGGPAMIRSAAKNNAWVLVVTSPTRYEKVLGDLRKHVGATCAKHRLSQAQRAFANTAEYDALIAKYLAKITTPEVESERQDQPTGGPARHVFDPHSGKVALATVGRDEEHPRPPDMDAAIREATFARGVADRLTSVKEFFDAMLKLQVTAAEGTEACVFEVKPNRSLVLAGYVRSQKVSFLTKESDTQSFVPLATNALKLGRDSATETNLPLGAVGKPAFVLVTLLRYAGNVDAVSLVVTRCDDQQIAEERLMQAQIVSDEYGRFAYRRATSIHPGDTGLPKSLSLLITKKQDLRYGENPHQPAALYVDRKPNEASVAYAKQHHGKELSYINLLDADGALACVKEFSAPAACIVKHTTPCGCATADDLATAFERAYAGDPLAAFGGIVAVNKPIDLAAATAITSIDKLLEVIVAPYYTDEALEVLKTRWKNCRLLEVGPVSSTGDTTTRRDETELHLHKITGGYLVQHRDLLGLDADGWKIASTRPPTPAEMENLRFAWLVCKHVKSNAIVVAKNNMLLGAGAGQMDRPSAARLAIEKAGDRIAHAVAASDAFFPFPDGPELLLNAGVTAIIHPGGSLNDQKTIDLVNARGAALVLTGQRHFKH